MEGKELMQKLAKIKCDKCGEVIELNAATDVRARILSPTQGATQNYFVCPKCKTEYTVAILDAYMINIAAVKKKLLKAMSSCKLPKDAERYKRFKNKADILTMRQKAHEKMLKEKYIHE